MKESLYITSPVLMLIMFFTVMVTSCKEDDNPINFTEGTYPDSTINLMDLNSVYDDYNTDIYQITGTTQIVFSSNRKSSGGQFDIEQGKVSFIFDQTYGTCEIKSEITNDSFLDNLIDKAITPGNDFGPNRFFSTADGLEYFMLSSVNEEGNLDLCYLNHSPVYGSSIPQINGPKPVKLLNTGYDDAYICFDINFDSAYFSSRRNGDFDIFIHTKPSETGLAQWFDKGFENSTVPENINSPSDDICPYIHRGVMVFTSNRPGGMGGYDLYYSVFKKDTVSKKVYWDTPVNFGPEINTSSDEYRPIIDSYEDYANSFLIFSSNRPGGKGGFDLYFLGLELPK